MDISNLNDDDELVILTQWGIVIVDNTWATLPTEDTKILLLRKRATPNSFQLPHLMFGVGIGLFAYEQWGAFGIIGAAFVWGAVIQLMGAIGKNVGRELRRSRASSAPSSRNGHATVAERSRTSSS